MVKESNLTGAQTFHLSMPKSSEKRPRVTLNERLFSDDWFISPLDGAIFIQKHFKCPCSNKQVNFNEMPDLAYRFGKAS